MNKNLTKVRLFLISMIVFASASGRELTPCQQVPDSSFNEMYVNPSLDISAELWARSRDSLKTCLEKKAVCLVAYAFRDNATKLIESDSVDDLPATINFDREYLIMGSVQIAEAKANGCILGMNLKTTAVPWLLEAWYPVDGKLTHSELSPWGFQNAFTPREVAKSLRKALVEELKKTQQAGAKKG